MDSKNENATWVQEPTDGNKIGNLRLWWEERRGFCQGTQEELHNSHLVILDQPAKEGRRGHYPDDLGHWLLLHSGERRGSIKNPGDSLGAALPGGDYERAAAATTAQQG